MLEKRKPIPVKEAVSRIMLHQLEGESELVSINESDNRVLTQDIVATNDVPHFTKSPYDGYAIRSIDTQNASLDNCVELKVVEELGAGMVPTVPVEEHQAVRIMTGTQMPEQCDSVIMLELVKEVDKNGEKFISIKRRVKAGENISAKGEDAKEGDIIVSKGTIINPGIKAILATFGYQSVQVAKRPKIGLFATGTELLDVDQPLEPGKIRNSNSYMISSQIKRAGAIPYYLGKLPDEIETCYSAVCKALESVDIVVTTGGVSVGDYDFMPEIYRRLGAEVLFNKVAMRPGSVTTVAAWQGKLLFGLSGNPSASYVGFELFVRPIIRTLLHNQFPHLRKESAILDVDFPKTNPFMRFVRSRLFVQDGMLKITPSGLDKSNVVISLAGANSLAILPGGTRGFSKGDKVDVLLLEDQEGNEWPW